MKNKTKFAVSVALPILVVAGFLGANIASAHGFFGMGAQATPEEITARHAEMFTAQANLLGVGVDIVKNGWAEGKTIRDIAAANGITDAQLAEKMNARRETQMKSRLQALVEKGVLTQAQADARLKFVENLQTMSGGFGKRGHGRMMGFGL